MCLAPSMKLDNRRFCGRTCTWKFICQISYEFMFVRFRVCVCIVCSEAPDIFFWHSNLLLTVFTAFSIPFFIRVEIFMDGTLHWIRIQKIRICVNFQIDPKPNHISYTLLGFFLLTKCHPIAIGAYIKTFISSYIIHIAIEK